MGTWPGLPSFVLIVLGLPAHSRRRPTPESDWVLGHCFQCVTRKYSHLCAPFRRRRCAESQGQFYLVKFVLVPFRVIIVYAEGGNVGNSGAGDHYHPVWLGKKSAEEVEAEFQQV